MIRALAGTPDRIPAVRRWPVREGLLAYLDMVKRDAWEEVRHARLLWAVLLGRTQEPVPYPDTPDLLKDDA